MDDGIHAFKGRHQPLTISHITYEEPQARVSVFLGHVELLQFIARIDHDTLYLRGLKEAFDALVAEGAGAAGDEDGLRVEHDDV